MSFGVKYGASFSGNKSLDPGKEVIYKSSVNGERYVYYKRLKDDGYVDLYDKALNVFSYRADVGGNPQKIAEYFFGLRDSELAKERELLQKKFGKNILSFYDASDGDELGEQLIKAFNTVLNIKQVFERNLALIKDTNGQMSLITAFPKYFDDELKARIGNFYEQFLAIEIEKNKTFSDEIKAKSILKKINEIMPDIVKGALDRMFNAGVENGIKNKELQSAYEELAEALKTTNNIGNEFIRSMIETYNLDTFVEMINDEKTAGTELKEKLANFSLKERLGKQMFAKGGLGAENLGAFIANYMQSQLGTDGKAFRTGGPGIKPDLTIGIGIDPNPVMDWLESATFKERVSRERNARAAIDLQRRLEDFDDGFLIYVNAKNQMLTQKFENRGGFTSGDSKSLTLNKWDDIMHVFNGSRGRDFIFTAMQLIPGAVGDSRKEDVSNMFARAIALALFDDINVIGKVEKSGAKSVHLLYLNGIYFPLSFYFDLIGRAFYEYSAASVADVVSVKINTPSTILFKTSKDQSNWMKSHPGQSAWREQQQDALNKISIDYHFLRAYKKFMSRLNLEELSF